MQKGHNTYEKLYRVDLEVFHTTYTIRILSDHRHLI